MLNKFIKTLWALYLFTFPFSLRFVVYEQASYRFGHFNPWVTGFLYMPEVLLWIVFIFWCFSSLRRGMPRLYGIKTPLFLFLLFIFNAGIVTYLNGDFALFGFFALRVAEAAAIYLLIKHSLLPAKIVIKILLAAAGFQLILGYLQWYLNHSLGLGIIGEQYLGPGVAGVAKEDLPAGLKHIRPYGTFLHPNIFAAYLMSILFIKLSYLKKYHLLFWLVVLTAGIYFTASLGAQLVTLAGFALIVVMASLRKVIKKGPSWSLHGKYGLSLIILAVLVVGNLWLFGNSYKITVNDVSWQERFDQNTISRNMFFRYPLGVGVSDFTLEMENFAADKLLPWQFQPVHNTYFLILNETGIQGLLLVFVMVGMFFYYYPLTVRTLPVMLLILIAPFDHFLWDSFAGILIIALAVGFSSVEMDEKA